jgi:ABC-type nitrate/sulfonate/bicarbonate transport system substrate-binding protein
VPIEGTEAAINGHNFKYFPMTKSGITYGPSTCLLTLKSFANENKELCHTFLKITEEATKWVLNNITEATTLLVQSIGGNGLYSEKIVSESLKEAMH